MYLMDWNLSLFTKTLSLEAAAHIWDIYLLEGDIFLMRLGLAILRMFQPKLIKCGVEKISPFLLHLPARLKIEELFAHVSQIRISRRTYDKIWQKFHNQFSGPSKEHFSSRRYKDINSNCEVNSSHMRIGNHYNYNYNKVKRTLSKIFTPKKTNTTVTLNSSSRGHIPEENNVSTNNYTSRTSTHSTSTVSGFTFNSRSCADKYFENTSTDSAVSRPVKNTKVNEGKQSCLQS